MLAEAHVIRQAASLAFLALSACANASFPVASPGCSGADIDLARAATACAKAFPTASDAGSRVSVRLEASTGHVPSGGSVRLVLMFTNLSDDPLPLTFDSGGLLRALEATQAGGEVCFSAGEESAVPQRTQ